MKKIISSFFAALAMTFVASAVPTQIEFTWKMNPYASPVAVRGGGANYNGIAYLLYLGSNYAGKQDVVESAFKSGSGLDLNNLPTGMALLDQCQVVDGKIEDRLVKTHTAVESLNNYWVMAVMFDGDYMLSANIQQPTYESTYKMGNAWTADGAHYVGPGTKTLPGPALHVSVSSFSGPYDGQKHGIVLNSVTGHSSGTPTVRYSIDGTAYDLTETQLNDYLPADVTAAPFRIWVKASLAGYADGKAIGTVTITKVPVTLTANSAKRAYDGSPLTEVGFTPTGFVGTEGVTLSMTAASAVTKIGKADNVIDEATIAAKGGTKLSNYAITCEKGVLEVTENATDLAATATAYSGTYDGAAHNIAVNITKKPAGSNPVITYSTSATGPFVTLENFTQQKDATAAKTIYAKVELEGYKTVELSETVTIAKRIVTVTAGSDSRAYNGSALTCKTYEVAPATPTETEGFLAGEGINAVTINSSIVNPGSVANVISGITYLYGTNKGNYDVKKVDGKLTVSENETGLAATATAYEGVYDGKGHLPTVNITEQPASGTPAIRYSLSATGPFVDAASFEMPKNVGEPVMVFAEVSLNGYKSYVTSATVKINKRPVILVAGSAKKEYDGTPLTSKAFSVKSNPDITTYPVYGFTGGDGVKSLAMTAESTVTTVDTKANEIDASQIVLTDGALIANYNIIRENGLLEVTKNTTGLKVQVQGVQANYSGLPTNVTVNVYQKPAGSAPVVTYAYSKDGPYLPASQFVAPKNATGGNVTVWVKVSLDNYEDVIAKSTISIAKRTVILVADNATWEYNHLPHTCGTWHVKDDPGIYAAYGFLPGEGVESLKMTAASTVTRPPCAEGGCSPVDNVIDETSLVAKEGTNLDDYNILFEKGTLRITLPPDTFLWLRYHNTQIVDNWGKPFNGKAYLIDYGVIPSPSNVGVSPDEQTLEKAFVSDEGIDLEDLPCRPAPSGEKLKVVKVAEVKDGEFVDYPDHTIDVHGSTTNWYKMVFFMESRTPSGDKTLDMYRHDSGAEWPRDTGYLKFPYRFEYKTTEEIAQGSGYPSFGNWNHWMYVGPGKLKKTITVGDAMLTAKLAWAQNFGPQGSGITGTGTYFARLEVACTNDWASTLSSVRFVFVDRTLEIDDEDVLAAQLYNTPAGGPLATTETFGSVTFRKFELALSGIKAAAKGAFVRFGPASVAGYEVSVDDRNGTPEMNNVARENPSTLETYAVYASLPDYARYCWLVWTTNGRTYSMPVSAVSGSGTTVSGGIPVPPLMMMASVSAGAACSSAKEPIVVPYDSFHESIAFGVPIVAGSDPSCKFSEFSMDGDTVSGRIVTAAGKYEGVPTEYATVTLLGAKNLSDDFVKAAELTTDEDGRFSIAKPSDYSFFRIKVTVGSTLGDK